MKIIIVLSVVSAIFYFIVKKKQNLNLKKLGIGIFILAILLLIGTLTGIIKTETALMVETEKVERRIITETVSASGKIQP